LALALASAAAAPPFFDARPSKPASYFFEISLAADGRGFAQLFYDIGGSYNERDSARQNLRRASGLEVYRFPLTAGVYQGLRFDPINHEGTAIFQDARIVDGQGTVVRRFSPAQFRPAHDIASLEPKDGGLEMRTFPGGDDPYLMLETGGPFCVGFHLGARILHALPAFLIGFFIVVAIGGCVPPGALAAWGLGDADAWMLFGGAILVLFKFWLVSAQTVFVIADAGHDDRLFLEQANFLLSGRWLGPYSQFTLMKGPMYSFFIAAVFLLGVPLFAAQHWLYAAACWLAVRALRPLVPNRGIRAAMFAVLLFNPATYDGVHTMRVARQDLMPALALIVVAGLVGWHARRRESKRRLLPWVLVAGVALPMFWLTREEGVWLMPCAGLLWAWAAVAVWRERAPDRGARLALLAAPAVMWVAALGIVAGINFGYYGIFTTCEFKDRDFGAAYGSLMRVTPAKWQPYIVVPREARERLYAVSPAFAELRPYLEGQIGENWAASSAGLTHQPPQNHEIASGWFMWALRDAVIAAGHGRTGSDAMAYYARLAREVNSACDRGLIAAGPPLTGFVPPLRREYLGPFGDAMRRSERLVFGFGEMSPDSPASYGTPQSMLLFADLTRGRLSPTSDGAHIPPKQKWLDRVRLNLLRKICLAYEFAAPWGDKAAFLALFGAGIAALIRRRLPYFLVMSAALLASVFSLMAICSLIDATSFPAVDLGYCAGCYAPVLLFMFTAWLALAEAIRR
jgi:hypothetical protein